MDATVKQMIDGFRMGVEGQAAAVKDAAALDPLRNILKRMEEIGNEPGMDLMAFQTRIQAEDLMTKYGEAMSALSQAALAAAPTTPADAPSVAPIDVAKIDLTDLNLIIGPHRQIYETTIKGKVNLPRTQAAYEAVFALAKECPTIPAFNRRAEAEGLMTQLGQAAAWDANMLTLNKELEAKQPDMITYALDALELTRDRPFPNSLAYLLNRLALANDRKLALRWSWAATYYAFAGELAAYVTLVHTEEQRQKTANLHAASVALTGVDVDAADRHPYIRLLLVMNDDNLRATHGPDWLGTMPFVRVAWYMDAALSPQEKKDAMPAAPPPCPHPYRTGAVGGVELTLEPFPFAAPTDAPYAVRVRLKNNAAEPRVLDVGTGVRLWVMTEEGVKATRTSLEVPPTLAAGEEVTFDGDLFAWGLPRQERLYLVSFTVGVVDAEECDLALKYADVKKLGFETWANHHVTPFEGGVATEPAFAMPRRPTPPYPFPIALT